MARLCKDGRIWGQTNATAGNNLGEFKHGKQRDRTIRGPLKEHHWKTGGEFKEGDNVGDKNIQWRGGIHKRKYPLKFNEKLKELIRERDSYKCQL